MSTTTAEAFRRAQIIAANNTNEMVTAIFHGHLRRLVHFCTFAAIGYLPQT